MQFLSHTYENDMNDALFISDTKKNIQYLYTNLQMCEKDCINKHLNDFIVSLLYKRIWQKDA